MPNVAASSVHRFSTTLRRQPDGDPEHSERLVNVMEDEAVMTVVGGHAAACDLRPDGDNVTVTSP